MIVKFGLKYCGIEESEVIDCDGMTPEQIEEELVSWVLEHIDHWTEQVE